MLMYMNGYNAIADNQKQSLATSQGNSTQTNKTSESGFDNNQIMQLALQMAMMAAASS